MFVVFLGGNMYEKKKVFTKQDTACIKGIAIILMFIHHLFAFPDRIKADSTYISIFMIDSNSIEYYMGGFGRLCVAIFMCLSGYGLYKAYGDKQISNSIILGRLRKIYIEYWKIFLIFIPIGMYLNNGQINKDISTIILNLLAVNITYNGEWWFLTPYLFTVCILPAIFKFMGNKERTIYLDIFYVITIAIVFTFGITKIINYPNSIFSDFANTLYWKILSQFFTILPSFLMGIIVAKYDLFSLYMQSSKSQLRLVIESSLILFGVVAMRIQLGESWDYIYAPIFAISVVALVGNIKYIYHILCKLGERSTGMWLIHSFYCYMYLQWLVYYPRNSILILLWLILLSYISSIIIDKFWEKIRMIYNNVYKWENEKI